MFIDLEKHHPRLCERERETEKLKFKHYLASINNFFYS